MSVELGTCHELELLVERTGEGGRRREGGRGRRREGGRERRER